MSTDLRLRRYREGDRDAVVRLHEWALREAGTDPADVPGTDDLGRIRASYLDAGGDFVVGVLDGPAADVPASLPAGADGPVAATGGLVPTERASAEERSVEGAAALHRMRVAPPCQGRGYGRALLAALERRAAAAGHERVVATTARRQRRAVGLYRAAGYEVVERRSHGEYTLVHFERTLRA